MRGRQSCRRRESRDVDNGDVNDFPTWHFIPARVLAVNYIRNNYIKYPERKRESVIDDLGRFDLRLLRGIDIIRL